MLAFGNSLTIRCAQQGSQIVFGAHQHLESGWALETAKKRINTKLKIKSSLMFLK